MTKYQCPVCGKRACDSAKSLSLAKLSSDNESQADIIIKCHISSKCHSKYFYRKTAELFGEHKIIKSKLRT